MKLSPNKLPGDKIWEILLSESFLRRRLCILTLHDLHIVGEDVAGLLSRVQLRAGHHPAALEPLDVIPELSLGGLPLALVRPVLGKVEVLVLVEHEADPARPMFVGKPQCRRCVQLGLRHLDQDGSVGKPPIEGSPKASRHSLSKLVCFGSSSGRISSTGLSLYSSSYSVKY